MNPTKSLNQFYCGENKFELQELGSPHKKNLSTCFHSEVLVFWFFSLEKGFYVYRLTGGITTFIYFPSVGIIGGHLYMFSIVLRNQTQGFMDTRQALLPTKLHSQLSILNYKTIVNFLLTKDSLYKFQIVIDFSQSWWHT